MISLCHDASMAKKKSKETSAKALQKEDCAQADSANNRQRQNRKPSFSVQIASPCYSLPAFCE
jgi:hypothetical protein